MIFYCSACLLLCCSFFLLLFSVFCSACFCFSLENDATHQNMPRHVFFVLHSLWELKKKNETFLNSVNIRRFCTGNREVFCKNITTYFFQENLCLSQESYTAHAEPKKNKKTRPGVCVFLALRPLPARSLTHSLTLGSLAEITL